MGNAGKMFLARAAARGRTAMLFSRRSIGTSLPVPTPPAETQIVFHSQLMTPKYSLSQPKWFTLFFAANLGAYLGHYFYLKWLMPVNPPNPPRNPDEVRPEKHLHAVDDE